MLEIIAMERVVEDLKQISELVAEQYEKVSDLKNKIAKVIVGQNEMVESIIISLLSGGHILLEGMPGLAKTLIVKTFAQVVDLKFRRVQFTPDLLTADLTGTLIFDQKEAKFTTRKGPIFTNILLADEINRAPAKVQSALLQSMEEKEVTIGSNIFPLPEPFLVMATENPIDQEGTYPLPEAQSDRFMMKLLVDYPNRNDEAEIVKRDLIGQNVSKIKVVLNPEKIQQLRDVYEKIYVDEKLIQYAVDLVWASRPDVAQKYDYLEYIEFGASPRASINLIRAAKGQAFLAQRGYLKPEDIRAVAHRIMRHRFILTYEAEAEDILSDQIVDQILNTVEVP